MMRLFLALCLFAVAACSGDDNTPETPLTGERIPVLTFDDRLEAESDLEGQRILLPPPYRNLNWTQMSGNAQKVMYHLSVGDVLKKQWSKSIGKGGDRDRKITSSPVVAMVWEGEGVVGSARTLIGATNPISSAPGTIRGDYGVTIGRNIIHGSDAIETAQSEIALWFSDDELAAWESCAKSWIYE